MSDNEYCCGANPCHHGTCVAQPAAPTSVYVECRECVECRHIGINDEHEEFAACDDCGWYGPSPSEDRCPECKREGCMTASCPRCGGRYKLVADADVPVDGVRADAPAAPQGEPQHESSTAPEGVQQEQHDDDESNGGRARGVAGEGNADQLRHDGREGAVGRSGAAEHDAGFLRPQQHADSGRGNAPRFLIDNDTLRKQIAADPDDEPSAGSLPPPEATRHPCGHLMVSDACVVCDSPAACKAHESCCRHDEPQIAPAEQPVRDAYTLPAPDVAALVERLCAWQAKITELRTALAGATAISNSAGATIRTLTKERDRAREALRDTLAWLDDPRMDTWPYMENGPFHDDRRVHQDKLRAALAEGKE